MTSFSEAGRQDGARLGRARRRVTAALAVGLLVPTLSIASALVAAPAHAATINASSGVADGAPGSLRAAVSAANANGIDDTIVLDGGSYHLDTPCGAVPEDANASGDLDHTDAHGLAIQGNGSTIDIPAACNDRVIHNIGTGTLALDHVTITGGHLTPVSGDSQGGGIWTQGPLVLDHATVTGNMTRAPHAAGGGILGAGAMTITASTISGNTVGTDLDHGYAYGGGVYTDGVLDITGSTISGNTASSTVGITKGGGIQSWGLTTIRNSTVAGNAANSLVGDSGSGGLAAYNSLTTEHVTITGNASRLAANVFVTNALVPSAVFTSRASVISSPIGSTSCLFYGTPVSLGYNFDADGQCQLSSGPGDMSQAGDPLLGTLGDNGGPTATMVPGPGSPLLDTIPPAACTLPADQRGVARPMGSGCEPGAVEALTAASAAADGTTGSLRAAVDAANANPAADTIVLDGGMYHLDTACGSREDANASGDLDHTDTHDLTIVGNGSTIDIPATCNDRVIENLGSATLTLTGVRITGGRLTGTDTLGGGVRSTGPLVLDRATITGNSATAQHVSVGGGVVAAGGLTMTASTVDGNTATSGPDSGAFSQGGGVYVTGTGSIHNSTIAGNVAGGPGFPEGGGLFTYSGAVDLQFSTVVGNAANGIGSNLSTFLSTVTSTGSVFAQGVGAASCKLNVPTSAGHNFDDGGSCNLGGTGDTSNGGDPMLVALGSYGGPTPTRVPEASSPLVDAVPAGSCPSVDQRGTARPQHGACDKGSVELSASDLPAAPTAVTATGGNSQATVSWTKPTVDGAAPVTSYRITASPGGATTIVPAAAPQPNSTVFAGLTNGTTYTFTVEAANAMGYGPASAASNAVTPSTVPGAPTIGTATPGNAQATVTWTAPASTGGTPITSYLVTSSPGAKTCTWTTGPLTCTVTALTNGTPYTFTVTATNANGTGPASAASNAVTPSTVPGAPTIGTATPGNTQATVTWTAPASTGGAPITSYLVTSSPGAKTCTWTTGPLTCTVTALTNGTPYTFTVTATNAAGTGPASAASNSVVPSAPGSGSFFHALAPVRILDSRGPNGNWNGPLAAGTPRTLQVTGANDVPANADAVVLNVTVTGASNNSFVTAYPAGGTVPTASNVNFAAGQTIPNLVTVKLGTNGQVAFANQIGTVHVVADLVGYYSVTWGDRFTPLAPIRILDSRGANGNWNGTLAAGAPRTLAVASTHGIPASANAVIMNVTVTGGSNNSFVTAYPAGGTVPTASNVNFAAGETIPNLVTVKLGTNGQVAFANQIGTVHVVADVVGYYDPSSGDLFHALAPIRILDSRGTNGGWNARLAAGTPRSLQVTGVGTIAATGTAVIGNTTVTEGTANSFVTVYPAGGTVPTASNVNFAVGQTIPNLTAVKVNGSGQVAFANNVGATHVIFDVVGYFAPT